MVASTTNQELAARMVQTLPGWGVWAVDVRDFKTPFGSIGFRQASILWVLRYRKVPDVERTPTGIAKYFGIQNSAITRAVDKLEQGGFVVREIAFEDRRRHYLVPTQKGEDISMWIEQLFTEPLRSVLDELTSDEIAALDAQVDKLFEILQRVKHTTSDISAGN